MQESGGAMTKEFKAEIVERPMLRLWSTVFDPFTFRHREDERFVPLDGLTLSSPVLGPKGGFLSASLKDGDGKVVWTFFKGGSKFYGAVKRLLEGRKSL
jgi:hypothetical protein